MTRSTTVVVGTLAALAVTVPAVASPSAAPTEAPAEIQVAKSWTTVHRLNGSKAQACKVSVDGGSSWRIYNRVDARNATTRTQAEMWVTRDGVDTRRKWSSGWVGRGTISAVGSLFVPRAPGYVIEHALFADQSGTGGQVAASAIGRC
jgi:hypothetical protein